jgi:MFS transporter, Spinster family, sphingosine-1-phosphate transporter
MESAAEAKRPYNVTKGQARSILVVLTVLYIINFADRSILSVVLQQIKVSLNISDTELGAVQSVFSVCVGLFTIPLAWMVDRWSRRKAVGIMALLWSVATFATGLATNFKSLVIARAFVGIGEDGFSTSGSGWLSLAFSKEKRGLVTGIFGIGSVLGTALGFILGGIIVAKTGMWQMPFYIFAVPGFIFGIWAFFLKDYASVKHEGEAGLSKKYLADWLKLFKIKSFTFTTLGQACFGLYVFTWIGWLPAFMIRAYGIDAGTAGTIIGGVALTAVLGSPVAGFIADRWQKKNRGGRGYMMTIVQLVNFILLATIVYLFGSVPIAVLIALFAVQMITVAMVNPLFFSIVTDISPTSHRIAGQGLMVTIIYTAGAAVGPFVVGAISDSIGGGAAGIRLGFLWLLPVLLASVIFYAINSKYYPDDSERVIDHVYSEK